MINEQNGTQMWSKMLKENFQLEDTVKCNWIAQYAANHEIRESALGVGGATIAPASAPTTVPTHGFNPLYATPLNTTGMGDVMAPGNPALGASADFFKQTVGSGDIPVSTLPMALNIALMTIGLELLPVIPAKGPWALLSYMDFPYAGGKLGRKNEIASIDGKGENAENKPLYFKVLIGTEAATTIISEIRNEFKNDLETEYTITNANGTIKGYYKGIGRMDGGIIFQVKEAKNGDENVSLKEILNGLEDTTVGGKAIGKATVDFAQTHVDFVDGFANFATGAKSPMTRAENETGTGNVIGARVFSKWIKMGSYEATGTVTRQQLQDLPLYGVDVVSKVMEACQNEISQHINARILEHVFALGVTNAVNQKARQNVDLNLYLGANNATKNLSDFGIAEFKDVYGVDRLTSFDGVVNAEVNTSAENTYSRQRRISSRILAAANLIQVTGRRGRATWVVTNAQVATALQDCSGYVIAPMVNNLVQDGSRDLYQAGTLAGIKVYVDPYMDWDDCRICVGRKGNGNEPGAVFMPYILADTVSITAEGTMAPKMLVNSRFAIADAGFYPETQYFTFAVNSEWGLV